MVNIMKKDSMGGHSRINPFAEKYRATLKARAKERALKMAKVDAPGAKAGVTKTVR
jgi:hypothetical protein